MKNTYFKKTMIALLMLSFAFPVSAFTPNDGLFFEQWYMEKIKVEDAWDKTTGSNDVVVAILDTGLDLDHEDLKENIWVNEDEIPGDGIDNDKNGFVDDVNGYNFVDDNNVPSADPTSSFNQEAVSHGTIMAGVIGAVGNNGIGIAGINWKTKLMSVRILDNQGVGSSSVAREGVEYAIQNGADVINMSFTGFDKDPQLEEIIKRAYDAGIVVVAAVGNSENGIDIDDKPIYPACYGEDADEDWILGVAATDKQDSRAHFSNYGVLCTDISAPGIFIFSTKFQDSNWVPFKNGLYQAGWSGTSMAVPIVAGAAALLKGYHPSLAPKEIKKILRLSVDPVFEDGEAKGQMGAGRLNIASAIALSDQFADLDEEKRLKFGELIKLPCEEGASITDRCRAVYFRSTDSKRHAFPNEKVFFTWFDNFDSVREVDLETMSTYQLGKNVTYHPGTRMVKFRTVNTVYAVERNGVLRAINSEQIASELYGELWNKNIDDIEDVFFSNYKIGQQILSASDYNVGLTIAAVESLNDNF